MTTTTTCTICKTETGHPQELGWVPYYHDGDIEKGPACPECAREKLELYEGEWRKKSRQWPVRSGDIAMLTSDRDEAIEMGKQLMGELKHSESVAAELRKQIECERAAAEKAKLELADACTIAMGHRKQAEQELQQARDRVDLFKEATATAMKTIEQLWRIILQQPEAPPSHELPEGYAPESGVRLAAPDKPGAGQDRDLN